MLLNLRLCSTSISCSIAYILSGYTPIVEGVTLGNLPTDVLGDNRYKRFCNGLCADIFPTDNYLHSCFWNNTLSLFICFLILAHTQIFLSRQGRGAFENAPTLPIRYHQSPLFNSFCNALRSAAASSAVNVIPLPHFLRFGEKLRMSYFGSFPFHEIDFLCIAAVTCRQYSDFLYNLILDFFHFLPQLSVLSGCLFSSSVLYLPPEKKRLAAVPAPFPLQFTL